MGHAVHFLQRLDRVNELQVELALTLYRDQPLLKEVLRRAELPDGAQRLAVSLADPVKGPFIVLTRAGQFVTCLGKGMRHDLHVVTRAQLDVAMGRVQIMRDQIDRIRQLTESGAGGEVRRLVRLLSTCGPRFCREDAQQLDMVAPLLGAWVTEQIATLTKSIFEQMAPMASVRIDRLTPSGRDALLSYGRMVWALGNLLPLLAVRDTQELMELVGSEQRSFAEYHLSAAACELLTVTHGHRAMWVMARSGEGGLSLLTEQFHPLVRWGRLVFRELSLAALAYGEPRLHERAVALLAPSQGEDVKRVSGLLSAELQRNVLTCPDVALERHAERGRTMLRAKVKSGAPDTIPADLAHAVTATRTDNWLEEPDDWLPALIDAAPWVARATLPELYLPRAWVNRLIPELTIEDVARWLKPCAQVQQRPRPATIRRDTEKPARNAVCSCGCGKKQKRCDRAAATA